MGQGRGREIYDLYDGTGKMIRIIQKEKVQNNERTGF